MIQKEREFPFILPWAIADPRPARDARRRAFKEVLLWDEAVAPQKAKVALRHARELTADSELQRYPVVRLIHATISEADRVLQLPPPPA
jgi:hypothetical protein